MVLHWVCFIVCVAEVHAIQLCGTPTARYQNETPANGTSKVTFRIENYNKFSAKNIWKCSCNVSDVTTGVRIQKRIQELDLKRNEEDCSSVNVIVDGKSYLCDNTDDNDETDSQFTTVENGLTNLISVTDFLKEGPTDAPTEVVIQLKGPPGGYTIRCGRQRQIPRVESSSTDESKTTVIVAVSVSAVVVVVIVIVILAVMYRRKKSKERGKNQNAKDALEIARVPSRRNNYDESADRRVDGSVRHVDFVRSPSRTKEYEETEDQYATLDPYAMDKDTTQKKSTDDYDKLNSKQKRPDLNENGPKSPYNVLSEVGGDYSHLKDNFQKAVRSDGEDYSHLVNVRNLDNKTAKMEDDAWYKSADNYSLAVRTPKEISKDDYSHTGDSFNEKAGDGHLDATVLIKDNSHNKEPNSRDQQKGKVSDDYLEATIMPEENTIRTKPHQNLRDDYLEATILPKGKASDEDSKNEKSSKEKMDMRDDYLEAVVLPNKTSNDNNSNDESRSKATLHENYLEAAISLPKEKKDKRDDYLEAVVLPNKKSNDNNGNTEDPSKVTLHDNYVDATIILPKQNSNDKNSNNDRSSKTTLHDDSLVGTSQPEHNSNDEIVQTKISLKGNLRDDYLEAIVLPKKNFNQETTSDERTPKERDYLEARIVLQ